MDYKLSFYNIKLYKDYTEDPHHKNLYYNTLSNKFAEIPEGFTLTEQSEKLEELKEKRMVVPVSLDETKFFVDKQNMAFDADFKKLSLLIAVSSLCNYQCEYCFQGSHKDGLNMQEDVVDSTINYIKNIIDKNNQLKSVVVTFFGGEPLLNLSAIRSISKFLIDYCKEKNIEYKGAIDTNGYLMTQEVSKELKELNIQKAQIVIDGFEEYYNDIRKAPKDAFNKVIDNIEHSVIPILLRINVTKNNQNEIEPLLKYLYSLQSVKDGKATISYRRITLNENNPDYDFTDEEWLSFRNRYLSLEEHKNGDIDKLYALPKPSLLGCSMLNKNNFAIDVEGYIYRCDRQVGEKNKAIGTVKKGLYENSEIDKAFRSSSIDEKCMQCKYMPFCKGHECKFQYLEKGNDCELVKGQFKQDMKNYLNCSIMKRSTL